MGDDEIEVLVSNWREAKQDQLNLPIGMIKNIQKKFKKTCDQTKREIQKLDNLQKQPRGRTRSGKGRTPRRAVYSDGKWINKGIDDAGETFDQEEKDYLKKTVARVRKISDLKTEHLKYLVQEVFLDELKEIQSEKYPSDFHDQYKLRDSESKTDLQSEIRTSLFTNEQRDYISGLLQGSFKTTIKDTNDDIKHSEINYVEIVMLYECIARIVKHVHKFATVKGALSYIRKQSREASGIEDDEDDDD